MNVILCVTQKDIEESIRRIRSGNPRRISKNCPVAIASNRLIKRIGLSECDYVVAGTRTCFFKTNKRAQSVASFTSPEKVCLFINNFDRNFDKENYKELIKPFSCEVFVTLTPM